MELQKSDIKKIVNDEIKSIIKDELRKEIKNQGSDSHKEIVDIIKKAFIEIYKTLWLRKDTYINAIK